jgi:transmembrane sensor
MSEAARIETEAAEWLSRRVDPHWSDDDQAELDHWLGQGYAHKAAFWRLEEGWERAARIGALGLPQSTPASWASKFRPAWKPATLAASLAIAALLGLGRLDRQQAKQPQGELIATSIGGHKVVPLEDGSKIELNTATLLRAAVTSEKREVWLENGEAYFDVFHSDKVPFIVHAGPKTVSVLGTQFSVRRDGDNVTVAVLSGRVKVTEAKAPESSSAAYVAAGSVAISKPESTLVTESAPQNVEAELAWREGQLIFRNYTLAEAAAEFNRYNERKVVVSGKAAEVKISGSFKASNEDGFGRLLRDAYGLNVAITDGGVRVTD